MTFYERFIVIFVWAVSTPAAWFYRAFTSRRFYYGAWVVYGLAVVFTACMHALFDHAIATSNMNLLSILTYVKVPATWLLVTVGLALPIARFVARLEEYRVTHALVRLRRKQVHWGYMTTPKI